MAVYRVRLSVPTFEEVDEIVEANTGRLAVASILRDASRMDVLDEFTVSVIPQPAKPLQLRRKGAARQEDAEGGDEA